MINKPKHSSCINVNQKTEGGGGNQTKTGSYEAGP
jgi:hypothetical protein